MKPYSGDPRKWGAGKYRDIPTSKQVLLARERHMRDLERSKNDPDFPYYFDEEEAERAIWFAREFIHHTTGSQFAGQKFEPAAWQEWDIIRPLFGWKRRDDHKRRFRKAFVMIARKNGKSFLAGFVALYCMIADREPGAEVYTVATKEQQARIVWSGAKAMIKASPDLREVVKIRQRELYCEELNSNMTPLGRDSNTQDGLNVHCAIVDEYHAHKTDEMLGVLDTATGAREQPLIFIITTAGFDINSPCKDEYDYSLKILANELENEKYFAYICTIDDPQKWEEPDEWFKANPQLGDSIKLEYIAGKVQTAKDKAGEKNQVLVKHLNVFTSGETAWMNMHKFMEGGGPIDWDRFKGEPCFAGFDMGRTQDMAALCLSFRDPDRTAGEPFKVFQRMFYWVPEDQDLIEKSREDGANYRVWEQEGWLTLTPGPVTRSDIILEKILQIAEEYDLREVALDAWSTTDLAQWITDAGINVIKHRQTLVAMKFPVDSYEELVLAGRIAHEDNPILRYNMSHAIALRDGNGNVKLMKNKSKHRIDGAVATVMSVGRLLIAPDDAPINYEIYGL